MNNHAVVGAAIAWSQRVDAWWSCWAISQAQTCPRPGFRSRRGPASDHLLQNFAIRNGTARPALTTKPSRISGQSNARKITILKSTLSIARMAGGRVRSRKVPQQAGNETLPGAHRGRRGGPCSDKPLPLRLDLHAGQSLLSVAAPKRRGSADLGLVALTGAAAVAGALLHRMFKTRPLEAELDLHRGECVE